MSLNILIWSISGFVSGYIISVMTMPYFNSCFNRPYSFVKQIIYVYLLSLLGFIGGFVRGYTSKDVITNIIELIK